jgi:hypothetical protein
MVANSIIFALISYGIAIIIAVCVAFIIKGIALIVQRGGKPAAAAGAANEAPKQQS